MTYAEAKKLTTGSEVWWQGQVRGTVVAATPHAITIQWSDQPEGETGCIHPRDMVRVHPQRLA